MKKILFASLLAMSLVGCTEQTRARNFGGNANVTLPLGQKLVTVAWKETNMWMLTRNARPGEPAETYSFKESSNWGLMQGEVVITEQITSPTPAQQPGQ